MYSKLPWLHIIGWLLEFYDLAIPKVILGWTPTYDSAHTCQLYSATPLGDQAANPTT